MLNTIKSYIEAAKARKEAGEKGFSLVELIVVVVILGILAAVAIPIFSGIQGEARKSAAEAAAANMSSEIAAKLAITPNAAVTLPAFVDGTDEFKYAWGAPLSAAPTDIDKICVVATHATDAAAKGTKGPGCA